MLTVIETCKFVTPAFARDAVNLGTPRRCNVFVNTKQVFGFVCLFLFLGENCARLGTQGYGVDSLTGYVGVWENQ